MEIGMDHECLVDPTQTPPAFCCAGHRDEFLASFYPPADGTPLRPGWRTSPTCVKLRGQLDRFEAFHKRAPGKWLISRRIARQIVEELRPLLGGAERETAGPQSLTGMFGVPIELVEDLPQGAVLRG